MVTQNGHSAIGLIVRVEFFLHCDAFKLLGVELFLEGDRGVVGTKDFCGKTLHVRSQVFVQRAGLPVSVNTRQV
jgi:hypothetical protein